MQETGPFTVVEPAMDEGCENVDDYLFLSLGFASKQNAWAGPDHWKYRKVKGNLYQAECSSIKVGILFQISVGVVMQHGFVY